MSLVVMVILACTTSGACRDHRVALNADISLRQCEMRGQIGLAQWAGDHPGLTIRRWRCVTAATEREPV